MLDHGAGQWLRWQSTTLANRAERAQHCRHPGFTQHRQAHAERVRRGGQHRVELQARSCRASARAPDGLERRVRQNTRSSIVRPLGLESDVHRCAEPIRRRGVGTGLVLVGRHDRGARQSRSERDKRSADRAQPTELTDDDAQRAERARPSLDSFSRTRATPGPVPLWRRRVRACVTVSARTRRRRLSPELRWKSSSARTVAGPRMPSGRPQSNPRWFRACCRLTTSSPRSCGAPSSSRRSPSRQPGLDQRQPVSLVACAARRAGHAGPGTRRPRQRSPSSNTPVEVLTARDAGVAEPTLQVANGIAVLTVGQREGRVRGIRRAPAAGRPCSWRRRVAWPPRRQRTRAASECSSRCTAGEVGVVVDVQLGDR